MCHAILLKTRYFQPAHRQAQRPVWGRATPAVVSGDANEVVGLLTLAKEQEASLDEIPALDLAIGIAFARFVHVDTAAGDVATSRRVRGAKLRLREELHQRHPLPF